MSAAIAMHSAAARRDGTLERILRDYESVAATLPDEVIAAAQRRHAARELSRLGWPAARDEHWRYANLRAFERLAGFRPARLPAPEEALPAHMPGLELPAPLPGFERWVFVDGVRVGERPSAAAAPDSASRAAAPWEAEQRLGLLGDMFAADTATLHVSAEAAIELLFVNTPAVAGAAVYPRLQVRLAAGATLKLVERHWGGAAAPSLVSSSVAIELGRGAQLTHDRLQQYDGHTLFSDSLAAQLGEAANYEVRQVALGASTARTSARVRLAGRGARVSWQAIAVGRGEQVHDTALKVEHTAPATRTEESFRGIAEEHARIAFSGHIHINEHAPGADARQSLRGLIEGAGAEIDLRPRLEINTDEVKAQHGATTGQLDDNLLFYLLSRGLDRHSARALLKWAFLGDVLRTIDLPALRSAAERGAAGQLPDVMAVGALSP